MWIIRLLQATVVLLSALVGLWLFLQSWRKLAPAGPDLTVIATFAIVLMITLGTCIAIGLVIALWINRQNPPSMSDTKGDGP